MPCVIPAAVTNSRRTMWSRFSLGSFERADCVDQLSIHGARGRSLVQLVHAESDPGGGHELQQDHVIALLVGVFAQDGLGAQVVVVGQQHGAVADGGVLLVVVGELHAAVLDVVADLEVHLDAVLLLVGHDIDVVAVEVVLQLVPQDVAVLLEVDALQLDAVHQGVALELHLGAGLVGAVVLEEDGALLDVAFGHGGLEEVVLLHVVGVAAEALHAVGQGGHEGGPGHGQLAGGADELQGQLAVGGIALALAAHAELVAVYVAIQLDQDGHHPGEQLLALAHMYISFLKLNKIISRDPPHIIRADD